MNKEKISNSKEKILEEYKTLYEAIVLNDTVFLLMQYGSLVNARQRCDELERILWKG